MPVSHLARRFASIFNQPAALARLASLQRRVTVPTFSFTATSLRHMRKVFDHLDGINNGRIDPHSNFLSDPAAMGLVNRIIAPPILTDAGQDLLAYRDTLWNIPAQAEYQLLKILYFGGYAHTAEVQALLNRKRDHMLAVLNQFTHRPLFLTQPSLLVIAEYIGSFPGALQRLLTLPDRTLIRLVDLGDPAFGSLCSDPSFPKGLSYLCRKIGGEYRRAEDRRLHQIVSMALLELTRTIPAGATTVLKLPLPYSNLLTEKDIFDLHANYTSDLSVWFDGVSYQVSTSMIIAPPVGAPGLQNVELEPQIRIPRGSGVAAANHGSRSKRQTTKQTLTTVINPLLSPAAEDYIEESFLRPLHGAQLKRVGHTTGERLRLSDGMVPGADFYVMDAANPAAFPVEFIEVKCVSGMPPSDISLTQAEYLRACRCAEQGVPYRLILVDLESRQSYEVNNFPERIATLALGQVRQFTFRVR